MRKKNRFNALFYFNLKKLILFITFIILLTGIQFDDSVQVNQKYLDVKYETIYDDGTSNSQYPPTDNSLSSEESAQFSTNEKNKEKKRKKNLGFVEYGVNEMDYRRQESKNPKVVYPNSYFSLRGAEIHSMSDVDLSGLFDLSEYNNNKRIAEKYKLINEFDEFVPRKYKYAIGATKRDRYYDIKKTSEKKLVLLITPKNFFADKNGKLVLLPSLALKTKSNSKVSTLLAKIEQIMNKAYPSFSIERVRHLRSKIILDKNVSNFKISDLKIKNGDELSVTFKDMPEFLEDNQLPSIKIENDNGRNVDELFDIEDELPLTPVGAIESDDFESQEGFTDYNTPITSIKNYELLTNNGTVITNEISDVKTSQLSNKTYESISDDFIDNELINDSLEKYEYTSNVGDKLRLINSDIELYKDEIDSERAVEPEKIISNDEIVTFAPKDDSFKCNYEIYFKSNKDDDEMGFKVVEIDRIISGNNNKTTNISSKNNAISEKIETIELDNCVIGSLVKGVKDKAININKDYLLIGLKHYGTDINLLDYIKTPEKSLFDIGIKPGDRFEAQLKENIKEDKLCDYDISITELDSDLSTNKTSVKLIPSNNTTSLLIYVETNLGKPNKIEHHTIKQKVALDDVKNIDLTSGLEKKIGGSKILKPVSVNALMHTPIYLLIKKLKYDMNIDKQTDGIFICGEKIINTKSEVPISVLSGICVLRFNI
ncbi:hypothetical protein FG379_002127 [Cryptosporidium bovis]|uniref:uncharacterized protein n=1 Tax=Cryptosporidium bovis TaxID=310047 RepID=UPI003519F368|nr:hypothetical protein FG379_002127 [Cryptosporidium bovis]